MQSTAARVAVAVGSIAAIVVLFVVLSGGDEESTDPVVQSGQTGTQSGGSPQSSSPPPELKPIKIVAVGGEPQGGRQDLTYTKGDQIQLQVSADAPEEVHIHGYDITEEVGPGEDAKFDFTADIDGVFEIELEDSGVELAQLTVKP